MLSAAQWHQKKRVEAIEARRRQSEHSRLQEDVSELLERLDHEGRVYGQQAFNDWLRRRSLTAPPAVVDRLDVSKHQPAILPPRVIN